MSETQSNQVQAHTEPDQSRSPQPSVRSDRRRRLTRSIIGWIGEASIGLVPLLAEWAVHRYIDDGALIRHLATCTDAVEVHLFRGCEWVSPNLDAEKCILSIVLSGLAGFAAIHHWGPTNQLARTTLRTLAMLSLGAVGLISTIIYAAKASGADSHMYGDVDMLLGAALIISGLLAIERDW